MKHFIFYIFVSLFILGGMACSSKRQSKDLANTEIKVIQQETTEESSETFDYEEMNKQDSIKTAMLIEFYTAYITECSKPGSVEEKMDALKNKYLTQRLLNELKEEEFYFDPVLNAQDCDLNTIPTLEVYPVQGENHLQVYYTFSDERICIDIYLVGENGDYQIDKFEYN